jgi:uncharacterized membrane protein
MSKNNSKNSRLVVLTFSEENETGTLTNIQGKPIEKNVQDTQAAGVWTTIEKAAKEADVKLDDAVIVYKTRDGRTELKQIMDITAGKGARRGTFWGLLIGLILGGPIGGALGGLALGAIYGGIKDKGIDDKFIESVGQAMRPRTSALFLLIKEQDYDQAIAYLRTFETEIFESELSEAAEEAVNEALEDEEVARAVESDMGQE